MQRLALAERGRNTVEHRVEHGWIDVDIDQLCDLFAGADVSLGTASRVDAVSAPWSALFVARVNQRDLSATNAHSGTGLVRA